LKSAQPVQLSLWDDNAPLSTPVVGIALPQALDKGLRFRPAGPWHVAPPHPSSHPSWLGKQAPGTASGEQPLAAFDLSAVTPLTAQTSPLVAPHQLHSPAPQECHPVLGLPWFRHPMAEREIRLSKAVVSYEIKRARRRSIGMVVGVEGLSVRAPKWVSPQDIESALRAKERWICTKLVEQRERAHKQMSARIEWREGAVVPYMGEQLIIVLDARVQGAELAPRAPSAEPALPGVPTRTLHLGLPEHAEPEQIRDAVQSWLQREAHAFFVSRVAHFAPQLGVAVKLVKLSTAKTRWGSASVDGTIRLHWRLVHFSASVIDYVVAHELAHLREMNPSPRFWDVVRSVMPEFDSARDHLRHAVIPD
jgi:predicted metal-dependent hydrolase